MQLLAVNLLVVAADMILNTALIALKRERAWRYLTVTAALISVACNVLLISLCGARQQNGAIGSALGRLIAEGFILTGCLCFVPRGLIDCATSQTMGKVFVAGGCLIVSAMVLRDTSLSLAISIGSLAYGVASVALGVVSPAEVQSVRDLTARDLTAPDTLGARCYEHRRQVAQ
jgi:hypothetical protein